MSNKVAHLCHRDEWAALERLNRITGLQFSSWPESLASACSVSEPSPEKAQDESLLDQVYQG